MSQLTNCCNVKRRGASTINTSCLNMKAPTTSARIFYCTPGTRMLCVCVTGFRREPAVFPYSELSSSGTCRPRLSSFFTRDKNFAKWATNAPTPLHHHRLLPPHPLKSLKRLNHHSSRPKRARPRPGPSPAPTKKHGGGPSLPLSFPAGREDWLVVKYVRNYA